MKSNSKEYGLGWFKFYSFIRLPLGLISGAVMVRNEYIQGRAGLFANSLYTALFILDLLVCIFCLVVCLGMLELKPLGYTLNNVMLGTECVAAALNIVVQRYRGIPDPSLILYFAVALLVSSLLWAFPNYLYFRHRKFLFTGERTLLDVSGKVRDERQRNIFSCGQCGYYGDLLVTDQQQKCPRCGSPLVDTLISSEAWAGLSDAQKEDYRRYWKRPAAETTTAATKAETPAVSPAPTITKIVDPDLVSSSEIRFCTKCGSRIIPGANFCRRCGTEVVRE